MSHLGRPTNPHYDALFRRLMRNGSARTPVVDSRQHHTVRVSVRNRVTALGRRMGSRRRKGWLYLWLEGDSGSGSF